MSTRRPRFRVLFFRTDSGREPVTEWLDKRRLRERAKLVQVSRWLEESGFTLGPPWLKKLDDEIWEVRVRLDDKCLRVLFYQPSRGTIVLLLAFSKKTEKTPRRELQTARGRMMRYWERRGRKEAS